MPHVFVEELQAHPYMERATPWTVNFTAKFKQTAYDAYCKGTPIGIILDVAISEQTDFHCPKCGRIQNGNNFDRITGFFHKIIYRLTHRFG